MDKYLVTIVDTKIYEVEVEADNIHEAQDLAILSPAAKWVEDKDAAWTDFGDTHFIWNEETSEWEEVNG